MENTVKILTKARNLVKKGWCKRTWAISKTGKNIDRLDSVTAFNASRYCARAAIEAAASHTGAWYQAICEFRDAIGNRNISEWNDSRRKISTVIKAFDRAISVAKAAEAAKTA